MEKILLAVIFVTNSFFILSCGTSEKKLKEMQEKTKIESAYEVEGLSEDSGTDENSEKTDNAKGKQKQEKAEESKKKSSQSKTQESKTKSTLSKDSQDKKTKPVVSKTTKTPSKSSVKKNESQEAKEKKSVKNEDLPFSVGEEIVFSLKYFALKAGTLKFKVKPMKRIKGERVHHFHVSIQTSSVFSMFYSVKDYAESFWSPKYKRPYLMKIRGKESKYVRDVQTSFQWDKMKARYQANILKIGEDMDKEDKTWTVKSKRAQDIISAIYYLRTFDLKVGETHYMRVAEKGKDIVVKAKVVRSEVLNTPEGKIKTIVVNPTFTVDGSWKQVGKISIWLSDDERKLPVRVDAKIKIGTIRAKLQSIK